ncbi:MAG: flagellar biosynthetic protein FliR [Armatimonadetes bacterium]|nr:flagellar biosynthetic protein FliR [Armatimonadota bacterium]
MDSTLLPGLLDNLPAMLIPAARAVGVLAFMPGMNAQSIPPHLRLLLAGGIALLVGSSVNASANLPSDASAYMLVLLSELGLGLLVGWAVSVFLESVRWSGEVLDMQIGLRMGSFLDPTTHQGSSTLGQAYYLAAFTIFLAVDGHHWVLAALARSYERIPPGSVAFSGSTVDLTLGAAGSALDLGVRVAAAGLVSLLLADVALALMARTVPNMNVFLVGMPAKLGVGLAVLAVSAPLAAGALGSLVEQVRQVVNLLLGGG